VKNPHPDTLKLVRASILKAASELYPSPLLASSVRYLVEELSITDDVLDREVAYLKARRWIDTKPTRVLGREAVLISLTPVGYDVASGIDFNKPLPDV